MSGFDSTGSIKTKKEWVMAQLNNPNNRHTCHYPGCTASVKPAFWGCPPHWFGLPAWARSMIWATYNPMQEIKKNPSKNYLEVVERVQVWIIATETWNTIAPLVRSGNCKNLGVEHLPL